MSKKQAPAGISWGKASDELKAKVKFVLQQAQNNRYSVSRIYAAHNAIFELQEAPQTCSTCLTSRVKKLREWWGANAKEDTTGVPTTGEMQEATSYEGVVEKHKINFEAGNTTDETAVLETLLGEDSPLGANEKEPVRQRIGTIQTDAHEADLNERVSAKLGELGVAEGASDEDQLEAYQLLAGAEDNPEDERTHCGAQVEVLKRKIAEAGKGGDAPAEGVKRYDMGEGVLGMDYTPSADDAAKGTILNADGSKVKAGTYTAADGTTIAVSVGGKATIK